MEGRQNNVHTSASVNLDLQSEQLVFENTLTILQQLSVAVHDVSEFTSADFVEDDIQILREGERESEIEREGGGGGGG